MHVKAELSKLDDHGHPFEAPAFGEDTNVGINKLQARMI
jgi:hypothetical protein